MMITLILAAALTAPAPSITYDQYCVSQGDLQQAVIMAREATVPIEQIIKEVIDVQPVPLVRVWMRKIVVDIYSRPREGITRTKNDWTELKNMLIASCMADESQRAMWERDVDHR